MFISVCRFFSKPVQYLSLVVFTWYYTKFFLQVYQLFVFLLALSVILFASISVITVLKHCLWSSLQVHQFFSVVKHCQWSSLQFQFSLFLSTVCKFISFSMSICTFCKYKSIFWILISTVIVSFSKFISFSMLNSTVCDPFCKFMSFFLMTKIFTLVLPLWGKFNYLIT